MICENSVQDKPRATKWLTDGEADGLGVGLSLGSTCEQMMRILISVPLTLPKEKLTVGKSVGTIVVG